MVQHCGVGGGTTLWGGGVIKHCGWGGTALCMGEVQHCRVGVGTALWVGVVQAL